MRRKDGRWDGAPDRRTSRTSSRLVVVAAKVGAGYGGKTRHRAPGSCTRWLVCRRCGVREDYINR